MRVCHQESVPPPQTIASLWQCTYHRRIRTSDYSYTLCGCPLSGKSSMCMMCLKYRIILLIVIKEGNVKGHRNRRKLIRYKRMEIVNCYKRKKSERPPKQRKVKQILERDRRGLTLHERTNNGFLQIMHPRTFHIKNPRNAKLASLSILRNVDHC